MEVEYSGQIFEKKRNSDTKFCQNLSGGSRVVPGRLTDGRTGRHDKGNSSLSQIWERT
jgi:hypothetical protein